MISPLLSYAKGMTEVQTTTAENPHIDLEKQDAILCVCAHGNSRSKHLARVLRDVGYEHATILGISDSFLSGREKLAQIADAKLIIAATSTDAAALRRFLSIHHQPEKMIVELDIPEKTHSQLFQVTRGMLTGEKAQEITRNFKQSILVQLEMHGVHLR